MFRRSQNIDLSEDWPVQTLGPRNPLRGMDDGSHPEGIDSGLQGPSHVRLEWIEAERLLEARKVAGRQHAAMELLTWTHGKVTTIEQRIVALDFQVMHDRNPIGRGQRKAQLDVQIAEAKRELVEWRDRHAEACVRAENVGVEVKP